METTRGGLTGSMLDGRYRIGSVIARGGMSTVYRGLDTRLDRPVAVKVMAAQYAHDAAFLTRFSREARLAAGLSHPGIVAVYDHGRDGEHAFLVMELVDGGTLRELLHQRGPLPVPVMLSILEPLLDALSAAHRAGLVHRDVKPENVLISSRGTIKVADFGLVRAVSSQTMATGDVILGTVAYLSPEQVETGSSDARSDVYSAGIVAWEMLAGEPPFTGENSMSVAYQHVHSDVPLIGDLVRDVPALLEGLLEDATQRDPQRRPRDAGAFAARLGSIRTRIGLRTVPVPVPTRRPPVSATDDPAAAVPHAGRTGELPARPNRATEVAIDRGRSTEDAPTTADRFAAAGGPRGTRVVAGPGPATADRPRAEIPPAPGPQPAPVRRRNWVRRLIWLVVILLLGAALAAGGWWLGDGRWAYAPPIVGLTQQNAERVIRDAGLIPQVAVDRDDVTPVGLVASAEPGAGAKLLRGSAVALVVSSGKPTVPSIPAGTTVEAARLTLTDARLTPRTVAAADLSVYDDAVSAGTVVRTVPAAGAEVRIGAMVSLVISRGPTPVQIPPVAGKSIPDARNALLVAGLTIGDGAQRFDADSADGTVLGTEPAAGGELPRGSQVQLVINTSLTVPDVRSRSTEQATAELQADGYRVIVGQPLFDAEIDSGHLVGTDPAAGSRIDPDSRTVTLIASSAVTVPDLTAGNLQQAGQTLDGIGLHYQVAGLWQLGSSDVIGQSPRAGDRIEPGETVFITVLF